MSVFSMFTPEQNRRAAKEQHKDNSKKNNNRTQACSRSQAWTQEDNTQTKGLPASLFSPKGQPQQYTQLSASYLGINTFLIRICTNEFF